MPSAPRVFLDTSAILAGLNSPTGAAGVILTACFTHTLTPVISKQVVEEVERTIPLKFPRLDLGWASFLCIPPAIVADPTRREAQRAYKILPTSDAPILASALKAKPDALVTWNTRDFMRSKVLASTPFPIFTPGEFLKYWRNSLST